MQKYKHIHTGWDAPPRQALPHVNFRQFEHQDTITNQKQSCAPLSTMQIQNMYIHRHICIYKYVCIYKNKYKYIYIYTVVDLNDAYNSLRVWSLYLNHLALLASKSVPPQSIWWNKPSVMFVYLFVCLFVWLFAQCAIIHEYIEYELAHPHVEKHHHNNMYIIW